MPVTDELTFEIHQVVEIKATIGDTWTALIQHLTTENSTPDNKPMSMVLEAWPGGRWFRDLGDAQGHLWGFVQVIKPPTLIEIHGPMFMSYAVAGHVQFRLTDVSGGVELNLHHRVLGVVSEEHRSGMNVGWNHKLEAIRSASEQA